MYFCLSAGGVDCNIQMECVCASIGNEHMPSLPPSGPPVRDLARLEVASSSCQPGWRVCGCQPQPQPPASSLGLSPASADGLLGPWPSLPPGCTSARQPLPQPKRGGRKGNPGPVRRCSPRTNETNTAFALNRQSAPAFIGVAELNFVWLAEGRNNKTNTSKHGTVSSSSSSSSSIYQIPNTEHMAYRL